MSGGMPLLCVAGFILSLSQGRRRCQAWETGRNSAGRRQRWRRRWAEHRRLVMIHVQFNAFRLKALGVVAVSGMSLESLNGAQGFELRGINAEEPPKPLPRRRWPHEVKDKDLHRQLLHHTRLPEPFYEVEP